MDFILEVYKIERAALDADFLGTPEHLEMRQTLSGAVMNEFKAWLDAEQVRHPPKGPMGEAIGYALGQWNALTLFLTDPHLPIDNNASERALRVAASAARTSSSSEPTRPARTWPASTRSSRPARRTVSTRSTTLPICSSACRPTRPRGSTSCCRTTGSRRDPSRRPEQVGGELEQT